MHQLNISTYAPFGDQCRIYQQLLINYYSQSYYVLQCTADSKSGLNVSESSVQYANQGTSIKQCVETSRWIIVCPS